MSEAQNFYISGGTLGSSAPSYVTRRADEDLLRHLLEGDFCYVLTSRQMGKSSLMVRTADKLRGQGVSVAILDLTRIGQNVSLEQWYGGLLFRLGTYLHLEEELDDYWTSEQVSRLGPMQRFMGALREVVLPAAKGNVSIFIDEIDSVRSLPFSSDEFFAGIRECYNSRVADPEFNRLSFCLLGVAQPSDLISNAYITPFNIGHRIELTDFTETEAWPLLEGLQSKSRKREGAKAILRRVLYWTGGHPYLTQKLCETLQQVDGDVAPKDVDRVCAEMFLSSRSREQQDNLIFVRERVLASKENRAAVLDLYERVLRGEKVRDDDSNAIIDPLRLSGLLVISNGRLKVRNRIYATVFDRAWITANMPDAELRRQNAAYRRGIIRALVIGVPVVAVVVTLGIFGLRLARQATADGYFVATAQAQEAFNSGNLGDGSKIVDSWKPKRSSTGWDAIGDWLKGPKQATRWVEFEHWLTGRGDLERTFAMKLLRMEALGDNNDTFPRQDGLHYPKSSCEAEVAVATTNFQGQSLVAAAGKDSSVQIWYTGTQKPFRHLQFRFRGDDMTSGVIEPQINNEPLAPCAKSNLPGIMSLSFSPDGSKLAIGTGSWSSASNPGSVWIWDLKDNLAEPLSSENDFKSTVDSVQFSGDSNVQYLAASSEDSTAKVWKFSKGVWSGPEVFAPLDQHLRSPGGGEVGGSGANAVALSSTSDHLMALGFGDGSVVFYDYLDCFRPAVPAKEIASCSKLEPPLYVNLAHVSGVMSMVFMEKQGERPLELAIGTRDGDLLIENPMALARAYSKARAKADGDEPVAIDSEDLERATFATERPGQGVLLGLAAMQNKHGSWLLTTGSNGIADLWTFTPRLSLLTTLYGHTQAANQAAFCADDTAASQKTLHGNGCVVSVSSDATVRLWERPFLSAAEMKSHAAMEPLVVPKKMLILPGQAIGVKFLNDQELITAVGATAKGVQESQLIAKWDHTASQEQTNQLSYQPIQGRDKPILGFDTSPDGKFLVFTSREGNLAFVDITDLTRPLKEQLLPVGVTLAPKLRIRCLDDNDTNSILPQKPDVAYGGCVANQRNYLVMGVADGADFPGKKYGLCLWRIVVHHGGAPAFAPVNRNACGAAPADLFRDDDLLRVGMFDISAKRDISTGDILVATSMNDDNRTCVAIWKARDLLQGGTPDPKLSGCPDPHHHVFDPHDFDASFSDMSFSPDGNHLAVVTVSSELYYWPTGRTRDADVSSQNEQWEQKTDLPSRGQVLAFSPDTETLAMGLQGGGIILWDTKYHRAAMEIQQHHGGVLGLAFSPDGNTLASSGNDGIVRVLQAKP